MATKKKPTYPDNMRITDDDKALLSEVESRLGLQGLKAPQIVRVALQRVLEQQKSKS